MTQVCKDGLMLIISSQDIPFHLLFATCWDSIYIEVAVKLISVLKRALQMTIQYNYCE